MKKTKTKEKPSVNGHEEKQPKINNIVKGNGLHMTLENVTVLKNNMNKPFKNTAYENSISSGVAIKLTPEMKKEIFDLLEKNFRGIKGLDLALSDFTDNKIKSENGNEFIYASVQWQEVNGQLRLKKSLPVSPKMEKFPYSFTGSIQIGFSFSQKFTFPCYLNGVVISEVLEQEPEFNGLETESEYNPVLEFNQVSKAKEEVREEIEKAQEEEKPKKWNFWKKK